MKGPVKKGASYEDLEALPPGVVGEITETELWATPRPASPHARAASVLLSELSGPFDRGREGPGGWWILMEPELHLAADVLVPDLAAWRRERMPTMPDVPFFTAAPDWVCEVLSPATQKLDLTRKLPIYLRAGVEHAWTVDPRTRVLEVFRHDAGAWALVVAFTDEDKARAEPFDSIELELAALWLST